MRTVRPGNLVAITAMAVIYCEIAAPPFANDSPGKVDVATQQAGTTSDEPTYVKESLQGRVVWMAEALERRFGIKSDADSEHSLVALETKSGELFPIVKD